MAQCSICTKGNARGNWVSHSNVKTKRLFKPNLHRLSVRVEDKHVAKISMCAKCYKKIKNDFWGGAYTPLVPVSLLNQKKYKTVKKVSVAALAN